MSHTPGPWRIGYWRGQCRIKAHGNRHPGPPECVYEPTFHESSGLGIAGAQPNQMVVDTHYDELMISEADAQLIAAAPDLLEALKEVTIWLSAQRDYDLGNAMPEEYAAVTKAQAAIAKAEGR